MYFYLVSISLQGLLISAATLDSLDGIRTKYDLPSLAAGVMNPNRTVQAQAVGYRKFGVPVNATAHDQYHLGSNTKAMTCVLIARYIEEGNLTWESTLEQVLPQWRERMNEAYRKVTIAQLASHHSGITDAAAEEWIPKSGVYPEQVGDSAVAQFNMSAVDGRASYVEQAFNTTPTSPPNKWSYSNQNYVILGFIVDTLFGPFEEQLEERVWRPLNMTECGFGNFPEPNATAVEGIWPHELGNPDPVPMPPVWGVGSENPRLIGPAGTARCSPQSYAKFLALHLDGANGRNTSVLRASSFQRLHTPYLFNSGQNYTPGGWMIVDSPDPQVVNYLIHDGSNALNFATTIVFTRLDTAIFSLTNAGDSNPPNRAYDGVRETLQLFLNDGLDGLPVIENGTASSHGPGLEGIESDPFANSAARYNVADFHIVTALITIFFLL